MKYHKKPHHYFVTLFKKPQHAFEHLAPREENLQYCVSYTAYQKLQRKMRAISFASIFVVIFSAGLLALSSIQFPWRSPSVSRAATIFYTDTALGNDANACTAIGVGACKTISGAVGKMSAGDSLEIAAGTYVEDITLTAGKNNLTIEGASQTSVIIQGSLLVAEGSGIDDLSLSNFTINNNNNGRFGISLRDPLGAGPTTGILINNVLFKNISGFGNSTAIEIYSSHGKITIQNSTFLDNEMAIRTVTAGAGSIQNLTISNNIFNNQTNQSLMLETNLTNTTIKNNTFYKSKIFIRPEVATFTNFVFKNNIVSHGAEGIKILGATVGITLSYNNVFGNTTNYLGTASAGTGDISVDPQYVSASTGNFTLSACSPSIDTGDPTDVYVNEPDPNGGRINQGASGNTASAEASCSGGSRARRDSTPPAFPENISVRLNASCSVDISWKDPLDEDLAEIQILRSQGIYPITSNPYAIVQPKTEIYADTEIQFEETYHYALRVKDQTGNMSTDEPIIDVPVYTPEPLTMFTLDNISVDSLDVHFSLPSLEKIPEGIIEIWYQKNPFTNTDFDQAPQHVLSEEEQSSGIFHVVGLEPGTQYYFAARVSNVGCLFSIFSQISGTTLEAPEEEISIPIPSGGVTTEEPPKEEVSPVEAPSEEESISQPESASSSAPEIAPKIASVSEPEPVSEPISISAPTTPEGGSLPSQEILPTPSSSSSSSNISPEEEFVTILSDEEEIVEEKNNEPTAIPTSFVSEEPALPIPQKSFFDNPRIEQTAKQVITPAVLLISAMNVASSATAFNFFAFLQYLFTSPILLFGKKRRAWGVVFNSLSKMPVELAVVRLFDATTNRLIQTRVTDMQGRYQFLVDNGTYYLKVVKPGFVFPTVYFQTKKIDKEYSDLYQGGAIHVEKKDEDVIRNIPMDPIEQTMEHAPKLLFQRFMRKLQMIIAISGIVLALAVFLFSPSVFMFGVVLLHVLLFLLFLRLSHLRRENYFGVITNLKNRKPIKNAIVRIFETEFDRLLETQITDKNGRYSFLVGSNMYYLMIEKDGFERYTTEKMNFERKKSSKIVNKNFELAPLSSF